MKKKLYTRTVCITLSEEMFKKLEDLTNLQEISFSELIRIAIQEKFENQNN